MEYMYTYIQTSIGEKMIEFLTYSCTCRQIANHPISIVVFLVFFLVVVLLPHA